MIIRLISPLKKLVNSLKKLYIVSYYVIDQYFFFFLYR